MVYFIVYSNDVIVNYVLLQEIKKGLLKNYIEIVPFHKAQRSKLK